MVVLYTMSERTPYHDELIDRAREHETLLERYQLRDATYASAGEVLKLLTGPDPRLVEKCAAACDRLLRLHEGWQEASPHKNQSTVELPDGRTLTATEFPKGPVHREYFITEETPVANRTTILLMFRADRIETAELELETATDTNPNRMLSDVQTFSDAKLHGITDSLNSR